jgi:pimeloyl-ACP methyl ester carboxylesterase
MRQFIASDGTRLAYTLTGATQTHKPVAVLCDGISCDGFIWRYLRPALERRFRVLHVHYRGHGRSGLPAEPCLASVPHLARDLDEVMDRFSLSQALFLGHSMGVQVVLEMAFRYPQRLRAGVLLCGAGGRVLDTFKHTSLGMRVLPVLKNLTARFQPAMTRMLRALMPTRLSLLVGLYGEMNRHLIRTEDARSYFDHFATMPPDLFLALLDDAAERTSDTMVRRVTQPMLVVAGERDGFIPAARGQELAKRLPVSEFELVAEGSHTAPLELPSWFETRILRFIEAHSLDQATDALAPESPVSLASCMRRAGVDRTRPAAISA